MTWLHIVAGLTGIAAGAVALSALKGARLHRRSGMVFVVAMLIMSGSGAIMAALKPERGSVIAGVLTFYLVATALRTVRRPMGGSRWMDVGAMLVALAAGIVALRFGVDALSTASGNLDDQPAPVYFMFGTVALLAAAGDVRMILARGLHGARRLARHLWRMGFALFIATASFFLGQAEVFPAPLRNGALLAIPVLLVLLLTLYWLVRVRFTPPSLLSRNPRRDVPRTPVAEES